MHSTTAGTLVSMKLPWRRGASPPNGEAPDDQMTLTEHLAELRMRIIRSASLSRRVHRRDGLLQPDPRLPEAALRRTSATPNSIADRFAARLYILSPMEGFSTRFRVSMYGGVIFAIPVMLWQIWKFIVPGLHAKERKYAIPFIVSSVVLFLARRRSSPTSRSTRASSSSSSSPARRRPAGVPDLEVHQLRRADDRRVRQSASSSRCC